MGKGTIGLDNNVDFGCNDDYTLGKKFLMKKSRLLALGKCTLMYARGPGGRLDSNLGKAIVTHGIAVLPRV